MYILKLNTLLHFEDLLDRQQTERGINSCTRILPQISHAIITKNK